MKPSGQDGHSQIIRGLQNLNKQGCLFFIDANTDEATLMTSTSLRWLTHDCDGSKFYTNEQKRALSKIQKIKGDVSINKVNLKILLYDNPIKAKENKHIKDLLQVGGVEIRYLNSKNTLRIALQGKKLYLSSSSDKGKKVDKGWLYYANIEDDLLIDYYRNLFYAEFQNAKKIIYHNGGIIYADKFSRRIVSWCKTSKGLTILSFLGTIISILFAIFK